VIVYTRAKIIYLLKIDFIRFCIVGGTGFTINFIILLLLNKLLGLEIFIAQLIGAEVALFSNFVLHDNWTYKHRKVHKTKKQLIVQFHMTTWPAILGSAFMVGIFEKVLKLDNFAALGVSSFISLMWNFVWSKYVVWRHETAKEVTSTNY
jgi:dolichol-phosphate mannosyltransferase